jgi:hypothetical protein
MYYIRWTEREIHDLGKGSPLRVLLTEVNSAGRVLREIGLDSEGSVAHKAPTRRDQYGLFDNQVVDARSLQSNFGRETFEQLWEKT